MAEGVEDLRDAIEKSFGVPPRIYRAGRYGVSPETAAILSEGGIAIDTECRALRADGRVASYGFSNASESADQAFRTLRARCVALLRPLVANGQGSLAARLQSNGPLSPQVALPLALGSGADYVEPSYDNCLNGTYPLARYLYVYVNKAPSKDMDKLTSEFITFVLSKQGQEITIKDGYYPLPADVAVEGRTALKYYSAE